MAPIDKRGSGQSGVLSLPLLEGSGLLMLEEKETLAGKSSVGSCAAGSLHRGCLVDHLCCIICAQPAETV